VFFIKINKLNIRKAKLKTRKHQLNKLFRIVDDWYGRNRDFKKSTSTKKTELSLHNKNWQIKGDNHN
jgi:hypothetical protein